MVFISVLGEFFKQRTITSNNFVNQSPEFWSHNIFMIFVVP